MRPAFSVLFLTTLIGVGQGLFLALVAGQFYWVIGATAVQEGGAFYALGSLLALTFLALGLLGSFFHLARPARAWRAVTQWRTSWLSREVILLPAVMGLVFLYGGLHGLGWNPSLMTFSNMKDLDLTMAVGYAGAAAALLLFICTGMIYACMKFIQEWASPLVVLNFLLMGSASGFVLAAAYAALMGSALTPFFAAVALILTVAAFVGRGAAVVRNARLQHLSSLQTAIGLHHRNIRQISRGFLAGSFNTKEFFHPGGPELVANLRGFFLLAAFVVPIALLAAAWAGGPAWLFAVAFAIQYPGLLAERWVFFAEARHPQNLYYQRAA
jgi:DMSO reductase anchor subunit